MATMNREEKYFVYIDAEEHALRVQELLCGLEPWPEKFRALLPASQNWTATMVYGSSGKEAAERALKYPSSFSVSSTRLSQAKLC